MLSTAFLNSKVARRFFALFMFSVVLPVGVLGWLAFAQVETRWRDISARESHRELKSHAMSLLDRLTLLERSL
ncbi:MAG: hypothetical protein K0U93_15245 [Gammaproteobacteria bacterium]|nr:hypothetical protein [Gammaproteobacteria bacterium]